MSDDLVERVGRELARTGYAFAGIDLTDPYMADADYWNSQARAAIAVVLEEAADAVGAVGDHADGGAYINAIRAMIKKEDL